MTLRPFSIVYSENSRKGKYHFFDHRGQELAIYKKMPKNFLDKLLSYPITAFGYRFVDLKLADYINPKFDKKDVIKALDFWIEYFVYQNKCDYILENTVNKDFELHLEELIRVREAVLKEPADTKYVRQKIRSTDPYKSQNLIEAMFKSEYERDKELIEFTENVLETSNTPFSTVDQFCYKVKTLTRKKYEKQGKTLYNKDITQSLLGISGDFSAIMNELQRRAINQTPAATGELQENFRHGPQRWSFGGVPAEPQPPIEIVGTAGEELRPGDIVTRDENGRFRRTTPFHPSESLATISDVRFTSNTDPSLTATDGFFTLPVDATAQSITVTDDEEEPRAIGMMGEPGMITNIVGAAGEELHIGDFIYMDPQNRLWYKTDNKIDATAINTKQISAGQIIEAVREGIFIYPPGTTPTLYVDDSHLGFDADENVIIRRRLTMN
jgi:hypothetical protein